MSGTSKIVTSEQIERAKAVKSGIRKIFIVDDSYFAVDHFVHLISIIDPKIEILTAASTPEAKEIFLSNSDEIDLVLMDYRLTDAASGERLTKNFLVIKPELKILANSAMKEYNKLIMDAGAIAIISKKVPDFFQWWISYFENKI